MPYNAGKFLKLTSLVVVVLLVVALGVGNYFFHVAFNKDTKQGVSQYDRFSSNGSFDLVWYDMQRKEKVKIRSGYGYDLDGLVIYHPDTLTNTMVIVHGITADKWGMMKFAKLYADAGFNLVYYDQTKHGKSGGDALSYGYNEKDDLQTVVGFVKQKFPGGNIGIHGESFGGATSVLHSGINERTKDVGFYVIDCAYSDLYSLFEYRLERDFGLPNWGIVDMANMVTRWRRGYGINDISPKETVKGTQTPMLFIHGQGDLTTPFGMSEEMYAAKPGKKEILLVPDVDHALSFEKYPELYKEKVYGFIEDVQASQ